MGRSVEGVRFDSANQSVNLLFVLGTPKSNPMDYLTVVSSLCKILKDASTREALLHATTPAAFIETVVAAESRLGCTPSGAK